MTLNIGELYPKQILFCKATNKYICYGGARGGVTNFLRLCRIACQQSA